MSSVGFGFRRFLGRRRVRGVMDRGYRSDVAEEESKVADRDAIVRVVLDYFEGWFDGDAARMERTLHPDLAKRSPDDAPAPGELEKLTAREMIEATAKGVGKARDVPDRGIEVEVEHVHREIANVTVRSAVYVEYLHLVRTREDGRSSTPSGSTLEPRDGHAISVRYAASASRGSRSMILASTGSRSARVKVQSNGRAIWR